MAFGALRALTVIVAVLAAEPVPRIDLRGDPEKETKAQRERREAEVRVVAFGSGLLLLGLAVWGRDLLAMLRRRRAQRLAAVRPWHESAAGRAESAAAGWAYHPPPDKEEPREEAEPDANATVRIRRPRKP